MTPRAQTSIALVIGGLYFGMYRFGLLLGIELRLSSSGGGTRVEGFGLVALIPEGPAPGVVAKSAATTTPTIPIPISESDVTLVVGVPELVTMPEDRLARTLVAEVELEGALDVLPLPPSDVGLEEALAGVLMNSSPV